ncbi:MAG: hypothetical protein QOG44_2828 [Acidimicrobiaceae bacterium]|jgi:hypothetical protein|nr:hypothetical protein [Acidimicrobiaceae bacterium]
MAEQSDVRRIALALPEATESEDGFAFSVRNKGKEKGFVWVWQERITPEKPRVPNPAVIAVRVANESQKQLLLAADDEKFFTEAHYNGFPAVLVRVAAIDAGELEELIVDAWRCLAPKALVAEFDRNGGAP